MSPALLCPRGNTTMAKCCFHTVEILAAKQTNIEVRASRASGPPVGHLSTAGTWGHSPCKDDPSCMLQML